MLRKSPYLPTKCKQISAFTIAPTRRIENNRLFSRELFASGVYTPRHAVYSLSSFCNRIIKIVKYARTNSTNEDLHNVQNYLFSLYFLGGGKKVKNNVKISEIKKYLIWFSNFKNHQKKVSSIGKLKKKIINIINTYLLSVSKIKIIKSSTDELN